jgi:hypothetical protein
MSKLPYYYIKYLRFLVWLEGQKRKLRNKIRNRYAAFKFVYGIGKLSKEYKRLSGRVEKATFAAEEFGKAWQDVIEMRDANEREKQTSYRK